MTSAISANPEDVLVVAPVNNTAGQLKLKAVGLTQKRLAQILGIAENTVSRQMKGDWEVPGYVEAVVAAWEIMHDHDRERWFDVLEAVRKRRERKS